MTKENNSDYSVKDQIKSNLDVLNSMEMVASIDEIKAFKGKENTVAWVLERLENTGYKVSRDGFGEIILDKKRIKKGLSYLKTDAEKIAFTAVPAVLKEGVKIGYHPKHKGRAYDTITFGAPVIINGQRGNMAVVVRQEGENYYKVHRLLMPDGKQFVVQNKKGASETAGGVNENSSLSPTDITFNNILLQTEQKSQAKGIKNRL